MSLHHISDPMQDMFIFETMQQLKQLKQSVINAGPEGHYSSDAINEIFRIMHTIKSASAMMFFDSISTVAHLTEDLFSFLRGEKPQNMDMSLLCDLILEGVDFMKLELEKSKNGDISDGDYEPLIVKIKEYLIDLKIQNESICR